MVVGPPIEIPPLKARRCFRLIFSAAGKNGNGLVGQNEPANMLRANAAAAADGGIEARVLALRAWSLAHGLAMLILDGQLDFNEALLDEVLTKPDA